MHINHHSMCALLAADKLIISFFLRFTLNKHLFPNASHSIEWKEWVLLEPDRTTSCAQQRVQNQYCISSIFALKIVTKSWITFGTTRQSWEISYLSADFKNSPFPPVPNFYLFINLSVKCAERRRIFAIFGSTSRAGWVCEKEHPCSERGLGSWAGCGSSRGPCAEELVWNHRAGPEQHSPDLQICSSQILRVWLLSFVWGTAVRFRPVQRHHVAGRWISKSSADNSPKMIFSPLCTVLRIFWNWISLLIFLLAVPRPGLN